ncbi:MAG: hypothetical protein FWH20_04860 [Oscillospiraceae bacterium]|nr:hypothetical protein [Oscillospiraceae bacterium]
MDLKAKMNLSMALGIVATVAFTVMLWVAYDKNFVLWTSLILLTVTLVTMGIWCWHYIARTKYTESLNPKKKKYHTQGNRKESRRKR